MKKSFVLLFLLLSAFTTQLFAIDTLDLVDKMYWKSDFSDMHFPVKIYDAATHTVQDLTKGKDNVSIIFGNDKQRGKLEINHGEISFVGYNLNATDSSSLEITQFSNVIYRVFSKNEFDQYRTKKIGRITDGYYYQKTFDINDFKTTRIDSLYYVPDAKYKSISMIYDGSHLKTVIKRDTENRYEYDAYEKLVATKPLSEIREKLDENGLPFEN